MGHEKTQSQYSERLGVQMTTWALEILADAEVIPAQPDQEQPADSSAETEEK